MDLDLLRPFAVALAMGGLIGLERERSKSAEAAIRADPGLEPAAAREAVREFAGIRTFPLIALSGALLAHLTRWMGPGIFIAGFAAFTLLVVAAYHQVALRERDPGLTTAVSALLVFALSGLSVFESVDLCAALGITVYLLLALKAPLRNLASRIDVEDIYAIGKFGAITLLVLPLLPDQAYGPYEVLNPRKIWVLVILIAAISLTGYLAVKVLGPNRGFGLTGLLGGLVSSTAVTLSFSEKSREVPALAIPSALAIVLACTTMTARVGVVTSLLNRELLGLLWLPLAAMGLIGLGACFLLYRRSKEIAVDEHAVTLKNPFELGPAIKFAALFAVVLLGARVLQEALGNAGLYLSGVAAGVTDVDAITLSMSRLSAEGQITAGVAATAIVLATMSNTLTKAFLALSLAGKTTGRWVFGTLMAQAVAGGAIVLILALLG